MNFDRLRNPFPYSDSNKRYHTFDYWLRQRFGGKVFKVPLNIGLSCPNRDGAKGVGGCTYCLGGSGAFAGDPTLSVTEQFAQMSAQMRQKWPGGKCIAYYQAGTNTYAPVEYLRHCFEPILAMPDVAGIAVATRADCLPPDVVEYLVQLSRRTFLMVELGLQTVWDDTAERINRCHTYDDFLEGYHALSQRGVSVCVHLINGLPGEDASHMRESARRIAALRPFGVKLHLLHVLRGTKLASEYESGAFEALPMEQYVQIVCDQLELFPSETVIQRVTGDGARDSLIAPLWSLRKLVVMNEIDKELKRRNSWQGKNFTP